MLALMHSYQLRNAGGAGEVMTAAATAGFRNRLSRRAIADRASRPSPRTSPIPTSPTGRLNPWTRRSWTASARRTDPATSATTRHHGCEPRNPGLVAKGPKPEHASWISG